MVSLHLGKDADYGYLKTGFWGKYLGPRGMKMRSGERSTMKNRSVYRSPNIVRVIKSRKLRWAGNVARMEEYKTDFKI